MSRLPSRGYIAAPAAPRRRTIRRARRGRRREPLRSQRRFRHLQQRSARFDRIAVAASRKFNDRKVRRACSWPSRSRSNKRCGSSIAASSARWPKKSATIWCALFGNGRHSAPRAVSPCPARFQHIHPRHERRQLLRDPGPDDRHHRPARNCEQIATAAMLHDVGKRFIPAESSPSRDDSITEERAIIESHPIRGYIELCQNSELDFGQLMMVYQHHEHVDGTGYPVRDTQRRNSSLGTNAGRRRCVRRDDRPAAEPPPRNAGERAGVSTHSRPEPALMESLSNVGYQR